MALTGRVLVSQTRVPAPDRDRGSRRVDMVIQHLQDAGWAVTFIAAEEEYEGRHAGRLRQRGVPTFAGYAEAAEVVRTGHFDLAVLAFWEPASRLLPVLRELSPATRIIVDSIDLHFLREARHRLGTHGRLDSRFGERIANELNTYHAADAVLAVSQTETDLLGAFLGGGAVFCVPLADEAPIGTPPPLSGRRGLVFVGNFRHLPNGEAVEYLCRDVLPRVPPALLAEHPLTIVGNGLDDKIRAHAEGVAHCHAVGWVPSVLPYLERARVCVVPLLHGAGVKGKVLESLLAGTPVVSTSIGTEGLDLLDGEHLLVGESPDMLATAIARLLTDADTWERLAAAGRRRVLEANGVAQARQALLSAVDRVLAAPPVDRSADGFRHGRRRQEAYEEMAAALRDAVSRIAEPDSVVLVVTKGDPELLAVDGRTAWHFPQSADGEWAGYHPADGATAVRHLDALVQRGARYFVLPAPSWWWLDHYEELATYLSVHGRRLHADDHGLIFEVGPGSTVRPNRERVLIDGIHDERTPEPPQELVDQLGRSRRYHVTQRWRPAREPTGALADPDDDEPGFDWIVRITDAANLPPGFLDAFLDAQSAIGAGRAQPAHESGPETGPPLTERIRGCLARVVQQPTPLPVLSVRTRSARGPATAIIDAAPITVANRFGGECPAPTGAAVSEVFVSRAGGVEQVVHRSGPATTPRISVLVATYGRPDLLAACLGAFGRQTLGNGEFEVVVVDDGSPGGETRAVLDRAASTLPLVHARIDHAGRSAAKNLAAQLARADLVLFFDDDDRPEPGLLAEHLAAHARYPEEGVAVLGYTEWAPELTVTPVMHYLTHVDKLLFAYGNLEAGQVLDWRGFWEGRLSCKRGLLLRHGLHDQRLAYSIDVELGWRLARHGLKVVYHPAARSHMMRPVDLDDFCRRCEAKGRAQDRIAALHGEPEVRSYTKVAGASSRWAEAQAGLEALVAEARRLEAEIGDHAVSSDPRLGRLHRAYRQIFAAYNDKGLAEAKRAPNSDDAPQLSVIIPIWSRTTALADMAARTVARIWEVARLRTEVIVIDNGSPHQQPLRAIVHRFDQNEGVATAWNTGIGMARAAVVAVVNSDCLVEPEWDEALHEAVTTGRRIAFPYTDHGDGLGFRQPDQAGTAGWCFALPVELWREIGPFDERFNPAYGEDTDYWHRAWELGVELAPVPAARVTHRRRTTVGGDQCWEWLLQAHRYKYGWKHGVDPQQAPPYYDRCIVEYHRRQPAGAGG